MSDKASDTGLIETILERLNDYRLPRLLELKKRVDAGEGITDNDMQLLERVMEDAHSIHPVIDRNPEVQPIYAQVTALYSEITAKAVENEGKSKD
ncbi:MAG: hypothetical protein H6985_07375 [Pseudomonadales bacterium]|nr:hypothetical protein [Pseudomonadales bacterium]